MSKNAPLKTPSMSTKVKKSAKEMSSSPAHLFAPIFNEAAALNTDDSQISDFTVGYMEFELPDKNRLELLLDAEIKVDSKLGLHIALTLTMHYCLDDSTQQVLSVPLGAALSLKVCAAKKPFTTLIQEHPTIMRKMLKAEPQLQGVLESELSKRESELIDKAMLKGTKKTNAVRV